MQGRTVTKKTDWFDLQEAHLQLQSYSQPMITQLGGLAGDQETLRADGALRPPALSAQRQCARQWSCDDAKSKYETAGAQSRAAVQAAIDKHPGRKA